MSMETLGCFGKISRLALLLVLFSGIALANFTYVGTYNGDGIEHASPSNAFKQPYGLWHDGTNLYVSDFKIGTVFQMDGNSVVKRIGSQGDGPRELSGPRQITVKNGRMLIADNQNNRIQMFHLSGEKKGLYEALGYEANSQITRPSAAIEFGNDILALDTYNNKVIVYGKDRLEYKSYFGSSGASNDKFDAPQGIAAVQDRIYITDAGNDRVKVYDSNYTFVFAFGIGKNGVQLESPNGIFIQNNMVFVADTGNSRIAVFTLDGFPIETFGSKGNSSNKFNRPTGVAVFNNIAYVADSENMAVKYYNITIDSTNTSVLTKIAEVEVAAAAFGQLSGRAQSAFNITTQNSAQSYIASAKSAYGQLQFSESFDAASAGLRIANEETAALQAQVNLKARQEATGLFDRLNALKAKSYDQGFTPDFDAAKAAIDSVVQKLNANQHTDAVDALLSARSKIDAIAIKARDAPKNGTGAGQKAQTQLIIAQATAKLDAAVAKNLAYKQDSDLSKAEAQLSNANVLLGQGKVAEAYALAQKAKEDIDGISKSLDAKAKSIDSALEQIASSEKEVAQSRQEAVLIKPDMAQANALLTKARQEVYLDPGQATKDAQAASQAAKSESGKAGTILIAAGVLFFVVGAVASGI
ncbi:hypothetical protein FJZ26_05460, partial [Candidatus Parvarchaeota archaeon]|nr:hypothetical protein [Candidatus Parvarchaeota archaeon]